MPALLEILGLIFAMIGVVIMSIGDDYIVKPLFGKKNEKSKFSPIYLIESNLTNSSIEEDLEDPVCKYPILNNIAGQYKSPDVNEVINRKSSENFKSKFAVLTF